MRKAEINYLNVTQAVWEPRCVFLPYIKTEYKKWSVWHRGGFHSECPSTQLLPWNLHASADVPVNAVLKLHFHLISNFKIMNPKLEKFIKIKQFTAFLPEKK